MATRRKRWKKKEKQKNKEKQKKKEKERQTKLVELPTDVLSLIISRLCFEERLCLSRVSKLFLQSVTVHNINFNFNRPPTVFEFQKLFSRFTSVTQIVFRINPRYVDFDLFSVLSSSQAAFRFVKALTFDWYINLDEIQLVQCLGLFPSLEELVLDVSTDWTDVGIHMLATNSPNLHRFDLTNGSCLTDRSLDVLANCAHLEHFSFKDWTGTTALGVCTFLRKRTNLKSLELPTYFMNNNDILTLARTVSSCENLTLFSPGESLKKDVFLTIISHSRSPLTSLDCSGWILTPNPYAYTMSGISALLRSFQKLTKFKVNLPWNWLGNHDIEMSSLVKSLPLLKEFYSYSELTPYATLFSLIHSCSLLESIIMTSVIRDPFHGDMPQQIRKNFSIQRIDFYPRPDSSLKSALEIVCPSLKEWR